MNIEQFGIIAGAVLSILAYAVPGFNRWFDALAAEQKQTVMVLALLAAVAVKFALSCAGKDATFVCTWDGAYSAVTAFVLALVSNAGVYKGTNHIDKALRGG